MAAKMIEYISRKAGLKILIEPEVVHYSEKGRTIIKSARYAKFVNGWHSHPEDDEVGIQKLDANHECQRFEDAEKVVLSDGTETREVINEQEYVGKEQAEAVVGGPEELKKLVALKLIKTKMTNKGKRYNARQLNDMKLDKLGVSR